MFARRRNQACSSARLLARLAWRSRLVVKRLRRKGDRNHRPHLWAQHPRILYKRIVAFVSISMGERGTDFFLVQGFEAVKSRCRFFSLAQALQNFGQAKLGRRMNGV